MNEEQKYELLLQLAVFGATAPWIFERWRFGLKTLLVATTLIAVGLATAAYLHLW